ncbi:MAG: DUF885 family protein [Phenylobacterium sp.]|uniref:DUF885 domain-containing protein n=1 Tax=Phenylobacterium sp. TaxID=1871053 RepID=UPI0025F87B80|nr:DUF885 family protein [Phenylobacterium sp.]MBI1198997.1 DUF885 family protein [Phenylobacterium sp.]
MSAMASAGARLRTLYEAEWAWRLDQFADVTGLDVGVDPDRPLYAKLPDASSAAQAARLAYWRRVADDLDHIDPDELSGRDRLDYRVYRDQIAALLERQVWRDFEAPLNADSAFWSETAAIARRPMRQAGDHERWIAQMRDLPRYFGEMTEQMRAGLRRGFTPPRVTLDGRESAIRAVAEAPPEASVYFTPFRAAPVTDALRGEALSVIAKAVAPAHRELLRFFEEEYRPGCRETLAAADLPEGRAYYLSKVREHTTEDRSPEDIHAFGRSEVARLRTQMSDAMAETGRPGSLAAFAAFLRADPQFYARSGEELLMRAAWIAKSFDAVAAGYFGKLPRARFAIRPVPAEIAPYYTAGRGGPGVYLLNTYRPETRPLYSLPALTLHESAPGHAFQIALAMEDEALPAFRRQTYLPAYAEGWALYCEHLGLEMGLYATPYERFGMLAYQVWRAARLVVDTGVHWLGWGRDEAIAYLADNTTLPRHEIVSEVDRYISWPGQALSYYLGEACIRDCRHRAEVALGSRFDIRGFHDMVLALGSVPLAVVREATDHFISAHAPSAP